MSASMTNMQDTFQTYFMTPETFVDFSIHDHDDEFRFIRLEEYLEFEANRVPESKFISFEALMDKHSLWGYKMTTFSLFKNGKEKVRYIYNPDTLILPILLKHLDPKFVKVHDTYIDFKEKQAAKLLREIDAGISGSIKNEYSKHFNE